MAETICDNIGDLVRLCLTNSVSECQSVQFADIVDTLVSCFRDESVEMAKP